VSHTFLVAPTGSNVGLTTVCMGLVRACERLGLMVGFYQPIAQPGKGSRHDQSTDLVRGVTTLRPPDPLSADQVEALLSDDLLDELMDRVVARYQQAAQGVDVVIVEALWAAEQHIYASAVNQALARTLDADVVLVCAPAGRDQDQVVEDIAIAAGAYGNGSVAGVVLNMVDAGVAEAQRPPAPPSLVGAEPLALPRELWACRDALLAQGLPLVGAVPLRAGLLAPRVWDLARALGADIIFPGAMHERRVLDVAVCGRTVPGVLDAFRPGTLLIAASDRHDVLLAASLASLGGTRLAGILLTHGGDPDPRVMRLCRRALAQGLPLLRVKANSLQTALAVQAMDRRIPVDDPQRAEEAMNHVAGNIDPAWLQAAVGAPREPRVSPAAFRHQLIVRARQQHARIVLPEGDEPRTIAAAALCVERGIARCVLLAPPQRVRDVAADAGLHLPDALEILDPSDLVDRYVAPMVALRAHKGLTASAAQDQLRDTVILGTMMLQQGDVDGLVSGAVHTTANTIRPALQLVRTRPGCDLVSSCFFMLLPDQVLVFADCAVNPDPDAGQLADIALATADTAAAFGIEPRVAMISYATGSSARGTKVEKVSQATARQRRPDLEIDGPLQYDAAVVPSVGAAKAPGSVVAGRARVFIFPDLNTGNTTYKAVQRSAGVVSIGPVLQGLAKPVNDLSRGALVEDIIFTIALTGIQAQMPPA